MSKKCLIISGGDFSELPEDFCGARFVIACDRGYEYAHRYPLTPSLIIGDFDSTDSPEDVNLPILRFPSEKDDTDTMLAVKYALEHGYDDIGICCAFGGRMDHTFANIQTAAYIVSHGGTAHLYGENTVVAAFTHGSMIFPRREGWSLSVFAVSERCGGVSIKGTKYEVEGAELTSDFPLGVSNTWAEDKAEISVENGILMVIQSKLKQGEHI